MSLAVIIWTVVSVIGLALSAWGIWSTGWDLNDLYVRGLNGTRRLVAWNNFNTEGIRAMIHSLNLYLGIGALFGWPPVIQNTIPVLVTVVILLVLSAAMDRFNRHLIISYYERHHK